MGTRHRPAQVSLLNDASWVAKWGNVQNADQLPAQMGYLYSAETALKDLGVQTAAVGLYGASCSPTQLNVLFTLEVWQSKGQVLGFPSNTENFRNQDTSEEKTRMQWFSIEGVEKHTLLQRTFSPEKGGSAHLENWSQG